MFFSKRRVAENPVSGNFETNHSRRRRCSNFPRLCVSAFLVTSGAGGASRAGFSLIELCTVIVVVGLLMASLVTVTGNCRESSVSLQCRSNLRQLAQTCLMYTLERGEFPWGMKNTDGYESDCWDFKRQSGAKEWLPGDMWGGYGTGDIVRCPKCVGSSDNWDGNASTGYNYNCAYLGKVEGDSAVRTRPLKWRDLRNAAEVVLFGDGGYVGGVNKFMRAPKASKEYDNSPAATRKAGTQAFRHGRGWNRHCNMAFVDGHVKSFRQPYTASGSEGWEDDATRTGFIGQDNRLYGKIGL